MRPSFRGAVFVILESLIIFAVRFWPLASLAFYISDVQTKMLGLAVYHGLLCLLGHT